MVQATQLNFPACDSSVPSHYNCVMMDESDLDEKMSANEMYYIIQTDMNSIKCHQKALKCEIADINSKFCNLAENCGIESSATQHSFFSGEPRCSTPLMSRSSLQTPRRACHYEDYLVQMMMDIPSSCLDESSSSPSPPRSAPILDNNHNAVPTPVTPDVVRSTRKNSEQRVPLHVRSIISNILNEQRLQWRADKENRSTESSSPGYPQSSESSDAHVPFAGMSPEREREIMSRMKYYCDFTIDRQQKVDSLRKKLNMSFSPEKANDQTYVPEDPFTRHIEGSETKSRSPRRKVCVNTNNMNNSSRHTTLQKTTPYHENIKVANVSKINRMSAKRNIAGVLKSSKKQNVPTDTTDSSYSTQSTTSSNSNNNKNCRNRKVHISKHRCSSPVNNDTLAKVEKLSSEDICSFYVQQMHSLGLTPHFNNKLITSCESFNDDGYKSQTLPRKGTAVQQSEISHIAKNTSASWPIIPSDKNCYRTSTPKKMNRKQTPPPIRMGCIGKSPETDPCTNTDKADSIFTDSPKSVSSGGMNAPCNSRNSPLNIDNDTHFTGSSKSLDLRDISIIRPDTTVLQGLSVIKQDETTMFKVPDLPARKHTSDRRRKNAVVEQCSTPIIRTSTPMPKIPRVHYLTTTPSDQVKERKKLFSSSSSSGQTRSSSILNKRMLIKKFKRFSENFYKVKAGKLQIETLANL